MPWWGWIITVVVIADLVSAIALARAADDGVHYGRPPKPELDELSRRRESRAKL